ncbi:MAG TPA: SusC/RagA family TonB-linked outer membrane protein [Puia sp.]|jgi:TonB-linked SusC/RagA family outer membrane protein|nr:SusC/RagA family TonB-linked outer membrane protein [Puia sp.]
MSTFKDRSPFVKARPSNQPFARSAAPYPRANHIASITKTLLLAVRLTGIVILIACLHASAGINAQDRISINMKSAPLEKVFAEIELRSGYTVFYNTEVLKYSGPITVEMKDAMVADVMRHVLRGLPLEFNIQDKTIFVKHVKPAAVAGDPEGPGKNGATPSTVSGIVQNEAGQPLVGATVYIKRLKKMAVTDAKGEVSWKDVPDGEYDVDVSYVGFERLTTTITVVNHEAVFTAALKQMMSKLDETVVKGYYTTTNRLNTGDVTTVKGEDIQKQPVSDPILALEGRVPGMYIQQTSGIPGAYSTIMIRGQSSIANGNDPLYIVDGVPFSSVSLTNTYIHGGAAGSPNPNGISNVQGGYASGGGLSPFNNLNPADIESIVVLKDADATAIYGSRGANGVVLITTKKGKAGKTRFDMNVFSGGAEVTRIIHLLNTQQYLAMRREAFANDGLAVPSIITNPKDNNYDIDGFWDTTRYTNWQKALIGKTANFTNAQGNLSGGNANTQFEIGGGYSKQGTVYPGDYSDQKTSAHINLTHISENQRFQTQFTTNYVFDNNNIPLIDLTGRIVLAPDAPSLYSANGNINWAVLNGTSTFTNPIAGILNTAKATTDNLISSLKLSYQIIPGLEIKSDFGYNHTQMNQSLLTPASISNPPPFNLSSRSSNYIAVTDFKSWIIEPQIDFKHNIGHGRLEALLGTSFQENNHSTSSQIAVGFTSDALISDVPAASSISLGPQGSILYHYNALYGRLNYDWEEKYLINVTARRDGSSRFGPGKQFGNFGAIGAGWIFSKESFIEDALPFLSFGKLRVSYGTTGNDQIIDYQYLSTYTPSSPTYQGITGLTPSQLFNPDFAWEVVKKLEGGLELGFLRDRILVTASYYRDRTGNQLVGYSLPTVTGFSSVQFNLPAVVQNSGMELTLNAVNVRTKSFGWTTALNLTIPQNKLVAFPNLAKFPSYATKFVVGKSLFIQEIYHSTGVNPQTGLYSFATKNTNGLPSSPQDLVITQPVTQKLYGGISNSLSYKGIQFDVLVQYVDQIGRNITSFGAAGTVNANQPITVLGRWKSIGNLTNVQRFGTSIATALNYNYFASSDGILANTSFFRLKNVAVSYSIPANWVSKYNIKDVRIYFQCQNLFTITEDYKGLDPETGGLGLPPLRTITAGIQVGF